MRSGEKSNRARPVDAARDEGAIPRLMRYQSTALASQRPICTLCISNGWVVPPTANTAPITLPYKGGHSRMCSAGAPDARALAIL